MTTKQVARHTMLVQSCFPKNSPLLALGIIIKETEKALVLGNKAPLFNTEVWLCPLKSFAIVEHVLHDPGIFAHLRKYIVL
jgi:hypothetical protein